MLEIAAADQDEDAGALIVERDERPLQIIGRNRHGRHRELFRVAIARRERFISRMAVTRMLLDRGEMFLQRFFRHPLQFRVDRGVNPVAFVHGAVPTDRGDDLLADVIHCVGLPLRILPVADHDLFRLSGVASLTRNESQIAHPDQRAISRLARGRLVSPRRKFIRALDQTGERGAFREGHVARRLPEVAARCRLRPVQSAAEIDPVQIQLHDFLFAEALFDPAGEKNFEQLAPESSFLERETVPRQLLRDRARPLPHMAGGEILQGRAQDADKIVAAVLIKFIVLDRDDRVHQIARQLFVGNGLPILHVNLAKDLVVPVEDDAGRFHLLEFREIKSLGFRAERFGQIRKINSEPEESDERAADRHIEFRFGKPTATMEVIDLGSRKVGDWHAADR